MKSILALVLCCSISAMAIDLNLEKGKTYLGLRHSHSYDASLAQNFLAKLSTPVISKGRVQIVELKAGLNYADLPEKVKEYYFPIKKSDLVNPYVSVNKNLKKDMVIENLLTKFSATQYRQYVENLVTIGERTNGEGINYIMGEFQKMGLEVVKGYNIVATLKGKNENSHFVIVGHMDTVNRTVGADDNASGAAGVLEMARVLTEEFAASKPENTIVFLVTEDEELGLLGAKDYVNAAQRDGSISKIKFSLNMDMIANNSNGVVDLETSDKYENLAKQMAEIALTYTTLKPNLVLNPWGSDHIPFIEKNIPAILSIENWDDHSPCWHKPCDTIEKLNFNYAAELLKMNLATILKMDRGEI